MAETRPFKNSSSLLDIRRAGMDDHRKILSLFDLYLGSPADSRRTIVELILQLLAWHLEVEDLLLKGARKSGPEGLKIIEQAELEQADIKAMIRKLQQPEADDDQAVDEFFEDMMQGVRAHFLTGERDLYPLIDNSSD